VRHHCTICGRALGTWDFYIAHCGGRACCDCIVQRNLTVAATREDIERRKLAQTLEAQRRAAAVAGF